MSHVHSTAQAESIKYRRVLERLTGLPGWKVEHSTPLSQGDKILNPPYYTKGCKTTEEYQAIYDILKNSGIGFMKTTPAGAVCAMHIGMHSLEAFEQDHPGHDAFKPSTPEYPSIPTPATSGIVGLEIDDGTFTDPKPAERNPYGSIIQGFLTGLTNLKWRLTEDEKQATLVVSNKGGKRIVAALGQKGVTVVNSGEGKTLGDDEMVMLSVDATVANWAALRKLAQAKETATGR